MMLLCGAVRCCVYVVGSFLFDVCWFVFCLLLSIGVECWCRYLAVDCCMCCLCGYSLLCFVVCRSLLDAV